MNRYQRVSVNLPSQQLTQIDRAVGAGEFGSRSEVMREALRVWLHRRVLHAGGHGAQRFSRSLEARHDPDQAQPTQPAERVELLFDAGDAKA